MQPRAGNRLVNVNGGLFVYKFMSRQQVTKPSVCGVTCLLHVTAAKNGKFVGQQISCYSVTIPRGCEES